MFILTLLCVLGSSIDQSLISLCVVSGQLSAQNCQVNPQDGSVLPAQKCGRISLMDILINLNGQVRLRMIASSRECDQHSELPFIVTRYLLTEYWRSRYQGYIALVDQQLVRRPLRHSMV